MNIRKIAVIAATGVAMLTLAGCGNSDTKASQSSFDQMVREAESEATQDDEAVSTSTPDLDTYPANVKDFFRTTIEDDDTSVRVKQEYRAILKKPNSWYDRIGEDACTTTDEDWWKDTANALNASPEEKLYVAAIGGWATLDCSRWA